MTWLDYIHLALVVLAIMSSYAIFALGIVAYVAR